MKSPFRPLILPLVVLALALCALPATATTYMMMSDQDLADQAPAVVEATVTGVDYAPTLGGLPATASSAAPPSTSGNAIVRAVAAARLAHTMRSTSPSPSSQTTSPNGIRSSNSEGSTAIG